MRQKIRAIIILSILLLPSLVWALEDDNKQPMQQEADYVTIDRQKGIYIYTGHVKMQQGSAQLQGDKVIAHVNKQGQIEEAIATGEPARYQTRPQPDQEVLVATAHTMKYYPLKDKIILLGDGVVVQGHNVLKGEVLEYNTKLQTVQSVYTGKKQTHIVIQPNALPRTPQSDTAKQEKPHS